MARSFSPPRFGRMLIVLSLLSAPVRAEQSSDVKKYMAAAASLFEHLEYERALAQVDRAKGKSSGPDDDALIGLYEGLIRAERGDPNASTAFALSLGINPEGELPLVVSPKVQSLFDGVKERVRRYVPREVVRAPSDEAVVAPALLSVPPPPPSPPVETISTSRGAALAPASPGVRRWAWIPGVLGAGALAAGIVLTVEANAAHDALVSGAPQTPAAAQHLMTDGKLQQTVAWALFAGGGAGVLAALGMIIWGAPPPPVQVSALLGPGLVGGQVSLVWP